jgi:hypothetical protein
VDLEDTLSSRITKITMKLWNKVDLMQAIHMSQSHKLRTLDPLIDMTMELYGLLCVADYQHIIDSDSLDWKDMRACLADIESALKYIYHTIDDSRVHVLFHMVCSLQCIM